MIIVVILLFRCPTSTVDSPNERFFSTNVSQDISIESCVFSRNSVFVGNGGSNWADITNPKGGVIYVSSSGSYNIIIQDSSFIHCSAESEGGAIYMRFTDGSLRIQRTCAFECCVTTNTQGHFACIWLNGMSSHDSNTIASCSRSNQFGYGSLMLYLSNFSIRYINSSMNHAFSISTLFIYDPNPLDMSMCTLSENSASKDITLWMRGGFGRRNVSNSNIVHNNSTETGVVYITGDGDFTMINCIFKNNTNTLFYVYSGIIKVFNCLIDHKLTLFDRKITSSWTSNYYSSNNVQTTTPTYHISHFSDDFCLKNEFKHATNSNQNQMLWKISVFALYLSQ